MSYQPDFFPGYNAEQATDYSRPLLKVKMIYLVIIKKSPTWHITRTVRAKRLILKSELRRVAATFYKVAELDVTVI